MQSQSTPSAQALTVSGEGILFVTGYASSLRVERGHLVVKTGQGRHIRESRLPRVSRPRLRRVVIYGKGGYATWSALEWIEGVGASFAFISRDGRLIASSGEAGPNQPSLRRAQVLANEGSVGLEIARRLLTSKLEGQLAVIRRALPTKTAAIGVIEHSLSALDAAGSVNFALALEAKAAAAYWGAWQGVRTRFARADEARIPKHWSVFAERQSPLSTSARKAVTSAGAMSNYLYALAESECRLALLAVGLDPGLGWVHRDAPYRDSAALDLLEPLRPPVDDYVMRLLETRTFSRREFAELPTGQVRLMPDLARLLAATLPTWERLASVQAEIVAKLLAKSSGGTVRIPGAATRGARGKGGGTMGRRSTRTAKPRRIPNACRYCGLILEDQSRQYCKDCLPSFKDQRTAKLVGAARVALAGMRSSPDDPARTPDAIAKRVAKHAEQHEAARAWEAENPGPHDREIFRSEIAPLLSRVSLPQMMKATGLSSAYCWRIRRGERVPHPMHWDRLRALCYPGRVGGSRTVAAKNIVQAEKRRTQR